MFYKKIHCHKHQSNPFGFHVDIKYGMFVWSFHCLPFHPNCSFKSQIHVLRNKKCSVFIITIKKIKCISANTYRYGCFICISLKENILFSLLTRIATISLQLKYQYENFAALFQKEDFKLIQISTEPIYPLKFTVVTEVFNWRSQYIRTTIWRHCVLLF